MQETQVQSLGQEDPLEKGMATHSSILAWKIPQTKEPGRVQFMGSEESDTAEGLTLSLLFFFFALHCKTKKKVWIRHTSSWRKGSGLA